MNPEILIIDDDVNYTKDLILLFKNNYKCYSAESISAGIELLKIKSPEVVLLDLMLNDGESGLDGIELIKKEDENLPIIMVTDYSSIETAIKAIRLGAYDYVSKSAKLSELNLVIEKSLQHRNLSLRARNLESEVSNSFKMLIGNSARMNKLKNEIKLFANNDNTILITGESGVGKELVTREIHRLSNRSSDPFIAVNCAAFAKELLESELFGHEKGAFTGAINKKIGKFEYAGKGTIFLDEVSELDMKAQVTLLRVLQEKEFERVGGINTIKTAARVIAATNKNLSQMVKQGKFREDLFYRLDVLPINVPPLRERKEDIPVLIDHFIEQASLDLKVKVKKVNQQSLKPFMEYDWPGNVRELSNYVTRSLIHSQHLEEIVLDENFNRTLKNGSELESHAETWNEMIEERKEASDKASRAIEKMFMEKMLYRFDGNISKTASYLGVDRTTLHKMVKRYQN